MKATARTNRWLRYILVAAVGVTALIGVTGVVLIRTIAQRIQTKQDAPHAQLDPIRIAAALRAEFQVEPHTCGLHALRSVYRAYGLDPDQENLRTRLGVDAGAVPLQSDTTGTLHPDLLKVLQQDGFRWKLLNLEQDTWCPRLQQHLDQGQHALLLVIRPVSGGLHWVAAQRSDTGAIELHDSLERVPQSHTCQTLDTQIVSAILVETGRESGQHDAYTAGLVEMARVLQRVQQRKDTQP